MVKRSKRRVATRPALLALLLTTALLLAGCGKPPKDLVVKDGKKAVKDNAYFGAETLETVVLPGSVTSIGKGAFEQCVNLRSVTLSEGLTQIGDKAFRGCESLSEIVIPSTVTDIGKGAFKDCVNLRSVTLPEGLTQIGDNAFEGCESLSEIVIPSTVTDIGDSAFEGCESLSEIVIPDTVEVVGEFAFGGCKNLTDATLPGDASYAHPFQYGFTRLTVTGSRISKKLYWRLFGDAWHYDAQDALESLTIAEPIAYVPDLAFNLCKNLNSVALPDTLTSIGESAFRYCESLKTIELPDGLSQIGPEAFALGGLTAISIPDSVTSIGDKAFWKCPLESADMPAAPDFVGDDPFLECRAIYRQARESFPAALEDAEDARDREGVLIPDGARVVPMDGIDVIKDDIALNGALYNLMPEDVRTADWSAADYAIVMASETHRNDNVTIITINAYGTSVNSGSCSSYSVYLCGRDGSAWLLCEGGNRTAEEIWERIRGFFTDEPEPEKKTRPAGR